MLKKLENKVVFITNGFGFWGKILSQLFQEHGAKIILGVPILTEHTPQLLKTDNTLEIPIHYTQETSWDNALTISNNTFGQIDVLINSFDPATTRQTINPLDKTFYQTLRNQLSSVFLAVKSVIPYFQATGGGSIVNLISIYANIGSPDSLALASSDGGVRTLSKSVAVQYAKYNIRSNCILMGVFTNSMSDSKGNENISPTTNIPMARPGQPKELSHVVLYLSSKDSWYITGTEIVVDGGLSSA